MKTVVCDIDGVLADASHRVHLIANPDEPGAKRNADWDTYFSYDMVMKDELFECMAEILDSLSDNGFRILLLTSRNRKCEQATIDWLFTNQIYYDQMVMRPENCRTNDNVLKLKQLAELELYPEDVLCIFEDRDRIVAAYRDAGYRVYQPQPGDF